MMFSFVKKKIANDIAENLETFVKAYVQVIPQGYESFKGFLEFSQAQGLTGHFSAVDHQRNIEFYAPNMDDFALSTYYQDNSAHFTIVCSGIYDGVTIAGVGDVSTETMELPLKVFFRVGQQPTKDALFLMDVLDKFDLFRKLDI